MSFFALLYVYGSPCFPGEKGENLENTNPFMERLILELKFFSFYI